MAEEKNTVVSYNLDPKFLELSLQVMNMESDVDVEALSEPFDDELYREREGGYGKTITYVPAKYYRERLNNVLGNRWTFLIASSEIIEEHSYRRYDKDEGEYEWLDGTPYVKVIGMLVIPGLTVQMGYGVKKITGDNASDALKAASTDALKKCCENVGIAAEYEEDEEVSYSGGSGGSNSSAKRTEDIDIDEVEYDDDELEDALEVEVTFGKYKNQTLEDIIEDDPDYIDWLYQNANEQDMADAASIVYRNYLDKEEEKKNSKRNRRGGKTSTRESKRNTSSKSGSRNSKKDKDEEEEKPKSSRNSSRNSKKEDDGEKKELIETINEVLDEEEYDEVTTKSLIASVSVSNKYPQGKSSLEQLTVNELNKLAEALSEDLEDED